MNSKLTGVANVDYKRIVDEQQGDLLRQIMEMLNPADVTSLPEIKAVTVDDIRKECSLDDRKRRIAFTVSEFSRKLAEAGIQIDPQDLQQQMRLLNVTKLIFQAEANEHVLVRNRRGGISFIDDKAFDDALDNLNNLFKSLEDKLPAGDKAARKSLLEAFDVLSAHVQAVDRDLCSNFYEGGHKHNDFLRIGPFTITDTKTGGGVLNRPGLFLDRDQAETLLADMRDLCDFDPRIGRNDVAGLQVFKVLGQSKLRRTA